MLYTVGNGWVLEDRGSRNGTFLGAEKISRLDITGPCVIHVGNPEDGPVLRIEVEQAAEAATAPSPSARPRRGRPRRLRAPARSPSPAPGWGQPDSSASLPGVDREPTSRIQLQAARVVKIGRRPDNDIVLADLGVSKLHAELRMSPTGRVPDLRPGQPQRHLRQRQPGQPGRADRGRHRLDRPRHLPAGRRRAERVHRRRRRPVRGARPAGRRGTTAASRRCCSRASRSRSPSAR